MRAALMALVFPLWGGIGCCLGGYLGFELHGVPTGPPCGLAGLPALVVGGGIGCILGLLLGLLLATILVGSVQALEAHGRLPDED